MTEPVYLDHHATSPVDDRVIDEMVEALRNNFGNAASRHAFGARAKEAVQKARSSIASLIGAEPDDILFTSGATESNNLIISGAAGRREERTAIITSDIEHPSILEPIESLMGDGIIVRRAHPNPDGLIDTRHK